MTPDAYLVNIILRSGQVVHSGFRRKEDALLLVAKVQAHMNGLQMPGEPYSAARPSAIGFEMLVTTPDQFVITDAGVDVKPGSVRADTLGVIRLDAIDSAFVVPIFSKQQQEESAP